MAGSPTISSVTPQIGALTIQQSTYGLTIPVVWGRTRITGNLIWYGDYEAIPITTTTSSGGKGGSVTQSQTDWTYQASVMMALAEGPILDVRSCWKGKQQFLGTNASTQNSQAVEVVTLPNVGSPTYTTVQHTTYIDGVSVELYTPSSGDGSASSWDPLVKGIDYTVAAGVYTFLTAYAAKNVRVTYTYTQTISNTTALGQINLALAVGTQDQPTWGFLAAAHNAQSLNYSGISYVYGNNYQLSPNAEVFNHSFEVDASLQFSSTIPDANPADVLKDFLSNPFYGADFPRANVDTLTDFQTYCTARGIFISPALTHQAPASQFITDLESITGCRVLWSDNILKMIPYCDKTITGNGVTYTAVTSPVYDLTDDDFLDTGEDPILVTRKSPSDCYNKVQLEFLNRSNQYNIEVMEVSDLASIQAFGLRVLPVIQMHSICDANVAKVVAQLILQRQLYIRNEYEFKLGWRYIDLEAMDLVTLTDPGLGYTKLPVRVMEVTEDADGALTFLCEDFPIGSASATLYPTTSGSGFSHNYNVPPGNANTPFMFESPIELTESVTGLEVWLATGGGANYGGCQIWASIDNVEYKRVGDLAGNSRYGLTTGTLPAETYPGIYSQTLGVHLTAGGQVLSGTSTDLDLLNTLLYVNGEYMAYLTANLTGASAYNLVSLNRGAYSSKMNSVGTNYPWARCDAAIAKIPLSTDYIGKTLYIKLLAYNVYGGALQGLGDVSPTTYYVAGTFVKMPPPDVLSFTLTVKPDATRSFAWDAYNAPIDVLNGGGYRIKYRVTGSGTAWASMTTLIDGLATHSPHETNNPKAGTYDFAIVEVDKLNNESVNPLFISNATIGNEPVTYGASGNLCPNSDWLIYTGTDTGPDALYKWTTFDNHTVPSVFQRHAPFDPATWAPTNGGADINNYSDAGGPQIASLHSASIPVLPGTDYECSVYAGLQGATAELRINWLNSGLGLISSTGPDTCVMAEGKYGGNTLNNFKRLWLKGTAPYGAAYAYVGLRKDATDVSWGGTGFVFFNRAMFCVAPPGVTRETATPWIEAGVDRYHGGGIEPLTVGTGALVLGAATNVLTSVVAGVNDIIPSSYAGTSWGLGGSAAYISFLAGETCDILATVTGVCVLAPGQTTANVTYAVNEISPSTIGTQRPVANMPDYVLAGVPIQKSFTLTAVYSIVAGTTYVFAPNGMITNRVQGNGDISINDIDLRVEIIKR